MEIKCFSQPTKTFEIAIYFDEDLNLATITLEKDDRKIIIKQRNASLDSDSILLDDLQKLFSVQLRKLCSKTDKQLELMFNSK